MNAEEAIKILRAGAKEFCEYDAEEFCEAYDMGIEALEKQIPQNPKIEKEILFGYSFTDNKDYYCPNCKTLLTTDYIAEFLNFCDECGQAIDWEEVKE